MTTTTDLVKRARELAKVRSESEELTLANALADALEKAERELADAHVTLTTYDTPHREDGNLLSLSRRIEKHSDEMMEILDDARHNRDCHAAERDAAIRERDEWRSTAEQHAEIIRHIRIADAPVIIDIHAVCPSCGVEHLDTGEWHDRPHKTHLCLACGTTWRPFEHPTRGVKNARAEAAEREADRLRHGVAVEGDFVCPNELRAEAAEAKLCERCKDGCYHKCSIPWATEDIEDDIAARIAAYLAGVPGLGLRGSQVLDNIRAGAWKVKP